jgi:hypothetical protein
MYCILLNTAVSKYDIGTFFVWEPKKFFKRSLINCGRNRFDFDNMTVVL